MPGGKSRKVAPAAAPASGGDRIGALPDEILHRVLSFLPAKQAVQTCVLARRWLDLWKSATGLRIVGADGKEPAPFEEVREFVDSLQLLRGKLASRDIRGQGRRGRRRRSPLEALGLVRHDVQRPGAPAQGPWGNPCFSSVGGPGPRLQTPDRYRAPWPILESLKLYLLVFDKLVGDRKIPSASFPPPPPPGTLKVEIECRRSWRPETPAALPPRNRKIRPSGSRGLTRALPLRPPVFCAVAAAAGEAAAAQASIDARHPFDGMPPRRKGGKGRRAAPPGAGRASIDVLPEEVLHHVLSFLPAQEAVRTCVLARRWRHLWRSATGLRISCSSENEAASAKKLRDFVDHLFLLRGGSPLDTCQFNLLDMDADDDDMCRIRLWIRHVLMCRVRVLGLNIRLNSECWA
ncbi:uncharacterized protein LOC112903542 [Panicum hallii]|uniref:uncharacterized protein LOC112903542 n=1 Tax=Panicum hallii TaxID=206008 RepID=UPI000DF4E36B|nr:uncharacterized protein LOC112903542 [Panicum hallii]